MKLFDCGKRRWTKRVLCRVSPDSRVVERIIDSAPIDLERIVRRSDLGLGTRFGELLSHGRLCASGRLTLLRADAGVGVAGLIDHRTIVDGAVGDGRSYEVPAALANGNDEVGARNVERKLKASPLHESSLDVLLGAAIAGWVIEGLARVGTDHHEDRLRTKDLGGENRLLVFVLGIGGWNQ